MTKKITRGGAELGRAKFLGVFLGVVLLSLAASFPVDAQVGRPWTIAEEIGLADFAETPMTMSPDRKLLAVVVERGRLDINAVEAELRIYSTEALDRFAKQLRVTTPPEPIVSMQFVAPQTPVIAQLTWTSDSKSLAFLQQSDAGRSTLMLFNILDRQPVALSLPGQDVMKFDILDRAQFAYTVRDPGVWEHPGIERRQVAYVGTGQSFAELVFPRDLFPASVQADNRSLIWVASHGTPRPLLDKKSGAPIAIYSEWYIGLALSADGARIATEMPEPFIPADWPARFSVPRVGFERPFQPGPQNTESFQGFLFVGRYAVIDVNDGTINYPVEAPTGNINGWHTHAMPAWSANGRFVALPSVYVPDPSAPDQPVSPCAAIFDVVQRSIQCLEKNKNKYSEQGPEPGYYRFEKLEFANRSTVAKLGYATLEGSHGQRVYRRDANRWVFLKDVPTKGEEDPGRFAAIKQGLNSPPRMVTNVRGGGERVIWNPNPRVGELASKDAQIYEWLDSSGTKHKGGLYLPPGYAPGTRYPLVIQAHGFPEKLFRPSGIWPTAFAARALAASGIAVLQIQDCDWTIDRHEVQCQLGTYEGAVAQLNRDGLIDAEKLGIIGFSRTVLYTLAALTQSPLHFAAASITDGVNGGFLQALTSVDLYNNRNISELSKLNEGYPFGAGLQAWLRNSPLFNMDKVKSPLRIVALGTSNIAEMWEPYAALRYLKKPVDLIVINTSEHILSNPMARLVSQGGTVDWMRFWLQGYEEPSPEKAGQYRRWEELCDRQAAANPDRPTSCVRTNR
jgi:hypothetical protein